VPEKIIERHQMIRSAYSETERVRKCTGAGVREGSVFLGESVPWREVEGHYSPKKGMRRHRNNVAVGILGIVHQTLT